MEFKRSRSDSITSAGSNGSAQRRGATLDHHSMNAHRRPLEEFLTALRKVRTLALTIKLSSCILQTLTLLSPRDLSHVDYADQFKQSHHVTMLIHLQLLNASSRLFINLSAEVTCSSARLISVRF